ncbi:MAG: hypothetical protein ABR549_16345 [Mycobacteriales bacterium]
MRPRSALGLAMLIAAVTGCSGATSGDTKMVNLRGTGYGGTPALFPKRPWTVRYSWDCTKQLAQGRAVVQKLRVNVAHADDGSSVEQDYLTDRAGKKGSGVLSYERPGAYVVRVTTDCDWRLRVDQRSKA